MSGILLPGQENQPEPDKDNESTEGSGLVLPKGYGSHRREKPKTEPETQQPETVTPDAIQEQPPETEAGAPAEGAAAQAAGRPELDLRFPPRGAQIQCPSCGNAYTTPIFNIIDLGENPELKPALLGGQINVAVCPNCQTAVQIGTPLIVHDPENEFLGAYVPQTGQSDDMQNQRTIGELTQTLIRTIPSEKRRGYLLQPRQFFDWERFTEKLWEFEGVTPEMLRRQREQSNLLQRLLNLSNDETALDLALERSKHLVDRDFFAMLEQMAGTFQAQGQQQVVEALLALREKLMTRTDAGRELLELQEKAQGYLQRLSRSRSREELLDIFTEAWDDGTGRDLVATLAMAAPVVDYALLMELAQRMEQASDVEERSSLTQLREFLLQVQEQQQQSQQASAQQVQTVLQEVLQANDTEAKLREYANYIDETFLSLLAANIQRAQQNNAAAAVRRLSQIYEQALAIFQENLPDEVRLLQQLIAAPDQAAARTLLQENRALLNKEFVDTMQAVEQQLRESDRTEQADRLKALRGQVSLML